MIFPVEIIEKILTYCDGRTLKNASQVNEQWKCIVSYLYETKPLHKWCCHEEIPPKELAQYLNKYNQQNPKIWSNIYKDWLAWQNCHDDIVFDLMICPLDVHRISCVAVTDKYIAVGSEDGRVKVFNTSWRLVYQKRHKAVKVTKIDFMAETRNQGLCLVIAYPRFLILDLMSELDPPNILEATNKHSVYKNYLCYEKIGGTICIIKVTWDEGVKTLTEVWFSRIYSPSYLTGLNIWDGICTLILHNDVKIIQYEPSHKFCGGWQQVTNLHSSLNSMTDDKYYQIFRGDLILSLGKTDLLTREDFLELFIMGPRGSCSGKLFNFWEVLGAFVSCIFIYGNTLVLGTDCGNVYFYIVNNWKTFNIRNYQKKIIIGRHPIISIDVKESERGRRFYVASTFCVHEISGFRPRVDDE